MPAFQSPSRNMPTGMTNANSYQTLGAAGFPDPSFAHEYFNDFNSYNATDWNVTVVGTGTQALATGLGGRLLVSNTNGATDSTVIRKAPGGFNIPTASPSPSTGKQTFFKFSGQLSSVGATTFFCGLVQSGATSLAGITDGIYIAKATGVNTLTLNVVSASTTVSIPFPAACTLTANTDFELGFMVDVYGNVAGFWNPTTGWTTPHSAVAAAAGTQSLGYVCAMYTPTLPAASTILAPIFGLVNTSAVANTMQVDYIFASNDR